MVSPLLRHVLKVYFGCVFGLSISIQANASSLPSQTFEDRTVGEPARKGLVTKTEDWVPMPKSAEDVLTSIHDKLRELDTMGYSMEVRLDFSLNRVLRRLENVDSKLGRLEAKFDVRVEKIEEFMSGKDAKDVSYEHMFRRIENLKEKINNNAAYLDARWDVKLDRMTNKLERLDRDLHSSMSDVRERLVKNAERYTMLENEVIKSSKKMATLADSLSDLDTKLSKTLQTNFDDVKSHVGSHCLKNDDRSRVVTSSYSDLSKVINETHHLVTDTNAKLDIVAANLKSSEKETCKSCNDSGNVRSFSHAFEDVLHSNDKKLQELDSDVKLYSRKVVNSMQDLWKSTDQLKTDLSNAVEQASRAHDHVRREFSRLHDQIEPLSRLKRKFSYFTDSFTEKVNELHTMVNQSLNLIMNTQREFTESCRRIQEDEMQEYDILHHIVNEMLNRSAGDMYEIYNRLGRQSLMMNSSLDDLLRTIRTTGKATQNALQGMEQKLGQCVFRVEDISWKNIDALCHQVYADMPLSSEELVELIRSTVLHPSGENSLSKSVTNLSSRAEDKDFVSKDYDMDYQLSDSDYVDPLND